MNIDKNHFFVNLFWLFVTNLYRCQSPHLWRHLRKGSLLKANIEGTDQTSCVMHGVWSGSTTFVSHWHIYKYIQLKRLCTRPL